MARRLRIKWEPDRAVDALLEIPKRPGGTGVLLAAGAGAGQRHSFMTDLRRGLAAAGCTTMTFDYWYMESGRKAPDRLDRLLDVHEAAADRLLGYVDRVVLAGKSMGGRVGSHLAGDRGWDAAGLVYYGYPLVPLGKSEPRATDHLERVGCGQLFFAGSRDRLSPLPLLEPLVARLSEAELIVIEDGDHSFKVPKRTGRTAADVAAELVRRSAAWISALA